VMRSYGDIEVIRSGAVAMSLEAKKLRLQPPVPAASRESKLRSARDGNQAVEVIEED
jgi:hypothetical protein